MKMQIDPRKSLKERHRVEAQSSGSYRRDSGGVLGRVIALGRK